MRHPWALNSSTSIIIVVVLFLAVPPISATAPPGYVDASTYGYDPEDATNALISAVNTGSNVFVPKMLSDWVIASTIDLDNANQTILFEEGTTVRAKAGAFLGTADSLFQVLANGVSMIGPGATLQMRQSDYTQPPYPAGEWRHGIALRGVKDATIDGLTIRNTGGDGIYVGDVPAGNSYCENTTIRNVLIDNAYRNGISVISVRNLLIDNSVIVNTSGTRPQAGIDFEPNTAQERLENFTVRNTVINNNVTDGIIFYLEHLGESGIVNGTIENVTVVGNQYHGMRLLTSPTTPHITIKDSIIVNNSFNGATGEYNEITYSDFSGNGWGDTGDKVVLGAGTVHVAPIFYSTDINDPHFMYLDPTCSPLITHGASDGSYLGARPVYVPEPTAAQLSICAVTAASAFAWLTKAKRPLRAHAFSMIWAQQVSPSHRNQRGSRLGKHLPSPDCASGE